MRLASAEAITIRWSDKPWPPPENVIEASGYTQGGCSCGDVA